MGNLVKWFLIIPNSLWEASLLFFNYATKDLGGYVDIDYFEYGN